MEKIVASAKVQEKAAAANETIVDRQQEDDAMDWAGIAKKLSAKSLQGGNFDMREILALQKKLLAMDASELIEAMEQIESLEIEDDEKRSLQYMMIAQLGEKDPELAVTTLFGKLDAASGASDEGTFFASVFGKWASQDANAATLWLDGRIAEGAFATTSLDGENRTLDAYEAAVLNALITGDGNSDPSRLEKMPGNRRTEILNGLAVQSYDEKELLKYRKIVEDLISSDDRSDIYKKHVDSIAYLGDYERLDSFLQVVEPDDETRSDLVESAAIATVQKKSWTQKITEDDVNEVRVWVSKQSPAELDSITGAMIAGDNFYGSNENADERIRWVLKYHEESANDDVLIGFLKEANVDDEQRSALLSQFRDAELGKEYKGN